MSLFSRIFYDCQLSVNCQLFRPRLSVMILDQVHSSSNNKAIMNMSPTTTNRIECHSPDNWQKIQLYC